MSDDKEPGCARAAIGDLVGLVVHDLRNPVATISANVSFVREVGAGDDPDVREALEDVDIAIGDLMRGLEQLAWVGRWIGDEPAAEPSPGDVRRAIETAQHRLGLPLKLDLPETAIAVSGGGTPLVRLIEILARNALAAAPAESVQIVARRDGEHAVIEVCDAGRAVGEDLRAHVFGLEGQQAIKGRVDGRYTRGVGLLAARALADACGATLEADGVDGAAVFRITLPTG